MVDEAAGKECGEEEGGVDERCDSKGNYESQDAQKERDMWKSSAELLDNIHGPASSVGADSRGL